MAWPVVARPSEYGGLGILDLERFSRALRLRWLWYAWAQPQRAWVGTDLPVDDIDTALFAAATSVTVHNGCRAIFWHSSWLHGRRLLDRFPLLYGHSRRKFRTVHEALQNGKWIQDVAYNLNDALLAEFFALWQLLQENMPPLDSNEEDQIFWKPKASGKYTAQSAYKMQFFGSIDSTFPKLIWKIWAPPKCKLFLWLLLRDRLWTAQRLQVRGWDNNYFCGLCIRNLETSMHLFVECPIARDIWGRVAIWSASANLNPSNWSATEDIESWFHSMITAGEKKAHILAVLTLWSIWRQRNRAIFDQSPCSASQTLTQIKEEASMWANAGAKALLPLFGVIQNASNQP